jgi:hypothetical protein
MRDQKFIKSEAHNKVNQADILFASALKMTGYLRRYMPQAVI